MKSNKTQKLPWCDLTVHLPYFGLPPSFEGVLIGSILQLTAHARRLFDVVVLSIKLSHRLATSTALFCQAWSFQSISVKQIKHTIFCVPDLRLCLKLFGHRQQDFGSFVTCCPRLKDLVVIFLVKTYQKWQIHHATKDYIGVNKNNDGKSDRRISQYTSKIQKKSV